MKTSRHMQRTFHAAWEQAPKMIALASVAAVLALGACHATAGAGKDISATGNAITNSAVQATP